MVKGVKPFRTSECRDETAYKWVGSVREVLGGSESDTAIAFAASGAGSMLAALLLPRILDRVSDRPVMLAGCGVMGLGLVLMSAGPGLLSLLPVWRPSSTTTRRHSAWPLLA